LAEHPIQIGLPSPEQVPLKNRGANDDDEDNDDDDDDDDDYDDSCCQLSDFHPL
jgi:hypothetical protein